MEALKNQMHGYILKHVANRTILKSVLVSINSGLKTEVNQICQGLPFIHPS